MPKQHGMFGGVVEIESRNEELIRSKKTLDTLAINAIEAALLHGKDPLQAEVKTIAGQTTTVGECTLYSGGGIEPMVERITEEVRVRKAEEAGEDPYASDYLIHSGEAYEGIIEALAMDMDPRELHAIYYHPNEKRAVFLHECSFTDDPDLSFEQLVAEAKLNFERSNEWRPATESSQESEDSEAQPH